MQIFFFSHALLAVGYSDQSESFIVRNSWGENWVSYFYCLHETLIYVYSRSRKEFIKEGLFYALFKLQHIPINEFYRTLREMIYWHDIN